ncbi:sec-independent protein translocase protein TatC [Mesoflavibacter sabulilitoris]|uniref:Sec-independent protein translocase protein TatC n=1 Tax=Mesoflavibacter zeaxanthinifaciens subsp. sabulilitoris TaxID=1520893 RepID=A0A2T1NB38_9FLAO|nr:twin-arginine translocase subunit TatC [Mesoflavibacter zeaxanthinifaciens]MBB3123510.1 sec-independent protein translocase protein TatC [Mesoflavibacter zeaxanthinifaciens subsp. sabulilitoris]PSG89359.1 twin-arginine translocase subunit TatC [Mesoflavibacter zeaxanthinifaciens subsp. sabulilitoris]
MAKKDVNEMSFLDHLEDLRWHLIRIVGAVILCGTVAFIFKGFIFDNIIFAPKKMEFPTYQWLCALANLVSVEDSTFCGESFPFIIQNRTMAGQFSAHIWTSIYAGFIIAFPYVIYQLWKFISPGLNDNERNTSRGFIIVSSLLFFLGVLFGYYVITPLSINFLGTYTVSAEVSNEIDISSYISLVRASVIASGIIFELPILIYFLTKLGLVTPEILRKYRKFALVIVLIISAVITPPDIASQIIVAIPVIILYEISIHISRIVLKRERKKTKSHVRSS